MQFVHAILINKEGKLRDGFVTVIYLKELGENDYLNCGMRSTHDTQHQFPKGAEICNLE